MATAIAQRSAMRMIHLRRCSSVSTHAKPSHHKEHSRNQEYLKPTSFIGSWEAPKDPKEAQAKLAQLRRDYAKQVKDIRKQYIYEMELQRQEQIRKEEARREEILRQREERKKSKAAAAKIRAAERKAVEDEFRQTLMKERVEKLEYWKRRQQAIEEKKNIKKELIRKQSSTWIDEDKLEGIILERIIDTNPL